MYEELKLVLFRKMAMSKYVNNSYLPPMAAGEDGVIRLRLKCSSLVIPEGGYALSGIAKSAGICNDPGSPQTASGMTQRSHDGSYDFHRNLIANI